MNAIEALKQFENVPEVEAIDGLKNSLQLAITALQSMQGETVGVKYPPPPPPRCFGVFGETMESVRARQDYEIYMKGWWAGFAAASPPPGDE